MRAHLLYPLLIIFALSSCARPDTAPPEMGLTEPLGGAVAPGREVRVQGYAFDPSGVASVKVNGQEVLPPEEAGKRLVQFRFRLQAPASGKVELLLEAEDTRGNRGGKRVSLVLDAAPPRIVLERVEREGNLYRVYGRVEDNVQVDRVVVQVGDRYNPLSLPKEATVAFSAEVPAGAVLLAVDAAGNRTSRRIP
ncbi:Ig-like domain-containing protein [Thermus caldilimi]|uniref:Ig-like domain-containing protein n=1 Tax=Thermus caldilimi TaxID=2483360 RepID=UPI0010765F88|nr:Ig-like domain-containing protein [Thermus caldilimi]